MSVEVSEVKQYESHPSPVVKTQDQKRLEYLINVNYDWVGEYPSCSRRSPV